MGLSNDLISQFVKITNDQSKERRETKSYGTIVEYNGSKYIRIDGSELLTPIKSTVSIKDGDRTTVTIKDHTAVVDGNLSDPAASSGTVTQIGNQITEFEIIIADKVTVQELEAERARISELVADNVVIRNTLTANKANIDELIAKDIVVDGILTANQADIDNLKTNKLDASVAEITYAEIKELEATDAKINNLQATYGEFEVLTANKFTAIDGIVDNLETKKLDAATAEITYASIADLNAAKATIGTLNADVADINTLIFGSASGSSIQTSFANAVIAQLGNAQIKSAMIENVSADKITAGDIITNNVRVMSEDGKLLISDETIQISDSTRVRVQIGKDAAGDYSINIWDTDGNLMFSEGGITDSAIKDAIIRNDMVSDDANISAHKLNISSLFDVINEDGSHTIKSSQIYLDDEKQTLNVAFNQMTNSVDGIQATVNSQGTALDVVQGKISSKVWQQDITNAIDGISVGGRNLLRDSDREVIGNGVFVKYADIAPIFDEYGLIEYTISFDIKSLDITNTNRIIVYCQNESNSKHTFGDHAIFVTTEYKRYSITVTPELQNEEIVMSTLAFYGGNGTGNIPCIKNVKIEKGNVATDWTPAPEDLEGEVETLSTKYSSLEQTVDGISSVVASHTTEISNKADNSTVTAVQNQVSSLEQSVEGFKTTVSNTYVTKTEFDDLAIGGRNLLRDSRTINEGIYSNNSTTIPIDKTVITENGITFCRIKRTNIDVGPTLMSLYSQIPKTMFNHDEMVGKQVTLSFKARASHTTASSSFMCNTYGNATNTIYDKPSEIITTEWKTFSIVIDDFKEIADYGGMRWNPTTVIMPTGVISDFYLDIREWKFELGNKATDWTPAPEDVENDISELGTRISSAETSIQQNSEQIELRATKTEVIDVSNTANSALTNANKAQSDIDNMEIGGRNYILNSDNLPLPGGSAANITQSKEDKILKFVTTSGNGNWCSLSSLRNTIEANFKTGDTFTFSMEIKSEAGSTGKPTIYFKSGMGYYDMIGTVTTEYSVLYYTGVWNDNNAIALHLGWANTVGTFYIKKMKFEKGNRTTDWTPAPEDVDTRISQAESKITTNADGITALSSRTSANESDIAELQITADGLTSRVASNEGNIETALTNAANAQSAADKVGEDLANTKLGNLIKNGYGEYLDNTNFKGATFARDDGTCPTGCYGFFNGAGVTEMIPYDINTIYDLEYYCRLHNGKSGNTYFSIRAYDVDGFEITPGMSSDFVMTTSLFYLAQDLKPGDTVVHFIDLTNWIVPTTQTWERSFIFYGYTDSTGYTYPDGTYSRYLYNNKYASDSSVDKTNNTITLSSAWTGPTFKAGTCVGHASSGSTYVYFGQAGACTNTEWKKYTNEINGGSDIATKRLLYAKSIRIYLFDAIADYCGLYLAPKTIDKSANESINNIGNRVTTTESLIQQLSESISMLVTDGNGSSLMTQTADGGWTFSMAQTNTTVDNLSQRLNELQSQTGSTSTTVSILQQALQDTSEKLDYVNIGTWEDEPCIELGESNSDYSLMITNTRILFRVGSNTPTKVTTDGLETDNIVVNDEIRQGGFVQMITDDGGWGLLWKGVTS